MLARAVGRQAMPLDWGRKVARGWAMLLSVAWSGGVPETLPECRSGGVPRLHGGFPPVYDKNLKAMSK